MRSVEPGVPHRPAGWPNFPREIRGRLFGQLAVFLRVAARGAQPCTANDGVQALRIAEAANQSLTTTRPIRLSEIPS